MSAIMNTVYNNYLTAYASRQITKYDTHKKSELRSVYNSIVKLNKDTPWYLPTTSKDTQHYAVDLKENARHCCNPPVPPGSEADLSIPPEKSLR